MKLTAKFLAAFVITLAIALAVTTWLNIRRESKLFDRDLRGDVLMVGHLVAEAHDEAIRAGDLPRAAAVISAANHVRTGYVVSKLPADAVPAPLAGVVAGGSPVIHRDDHALPEGRLDLYLPLRAGPGATAPRVLRVTGSLAAERRYLRDTKRRAVLASLAALALAAVVAAGLGVRLIARPTRALVDKAHRVGRGDFSRPVQIDQRDELGDLATEINAMTADLATAQDRLHRESAARVAAVEQLRHADRLMTVGRLSAGIAHELGTPLNVIEGRAKMIQLGEVEGDEIGDSARVIVEQSKRITTIVRQLLDFARRGDRAARPIDLVQLAGEAQRLLAATARKAGVELDGPHRAEPLEALADDGQVLQVMTNLVVNGIHATPTGGRVTIEIRIASVATPPDGARPGDYAVIDVVDTGRGMDGATRERIFEPFFTTKEIGEGTGLGLSVVHGIVHDHGGWVEVDSTPGAGSRFSVYLPRP